MEKSAPNSRGASMVRDRFDVGDTRYNPPGGSNRPRSPYSQTLEDLIQRRKRDHEIYEDLKSNPHIDLDQLIQVFALHHSRNLTSREFKS